MFTETHLEKVLALTRKGYTVSVGIVHRDWRQMQRINRDFESILAHKFFNIGHYSVDVVKSSEQHNHPFEHKDHSPSSGATFILSFLVLFYTYKEEIHVAERNLMKFNTDKSKVLHLGRKYSPKQYCLGTKPLESSSAGKDFGSPAETWAKHEPAMIPGSSDHFPQPTELLIQPDSRLRKVIISLYLTFVKPHLEYHMPPVQDRYW